MTLHKFFSEAVKSLKLTKQVNEAADDTALMNLTRNNILPSVFSGEYYGLRIPSAVLDGKKFPFWDKKYLTYPFVGINGYSDTPAIEAKHGNEASFMSGKLKSIAPNQNVKEILQRQVSEGTGISADNFLIFPQMPITSVGSRSLNKSMSLFTTYNKRDSYKNNLYPYNIQQALSVDENGVIRPDPTKKGGVILCTAARKAQMASNSLLYADKLNKDDVARLAYLDNPKILADQITGTAYAVPGGLLGSFMSGAKFTNDLPNGNPSFGKFDEFASNHGFVSDDGIIDFIAVRNWIQSSDADSIVEEFLIPYLLKSPFEKTYCWRILDIEHKVMWKEEIRLYNALNGRDGTFEDNLENIEHADVNYDFSSDEENAEAESEKANESVVTEANDSTKSIGGETSMDDIMAVFNHYIASHAPTFTFIPKERLSNSTRDDGRIVTKHSGIKRTFARILTKSTPLMDIDYKFCPKELTSNGMLTSYSDVFDYSPLFEKYADILDQNMPKVLKYTRIVGYTISFEYDRDIENAYLKTEGKGKVRSLGMLKYYMESPNSVKLREPTIFDVVMIRDKKFGNFLFSSYNTNPIPKNAFPSTEPVPEILSANHLLSDNVNGMHSFVIHDLNRVNISTRYNRAVN